MGSPVDRVGALEFTGRWQMTGPRVRDGFGKGTPAVEVVVRDKSSDERFVFILNQGGAGEGEVQVPVKGSGWTCEDAIHGQAITDGSVKGGIWRMKMNIEPWGYRVLRLVRKPAH